MVRILKPNLTEKEIFFGALDFEKSGERETYLRKECEGDHSLLLRVRALLSAHVKNEQLLNEEELIYLKEERKSVAIDLQEEVLFTEGLGKTLLRLGDYEILEEIGRGAMGVVYRAKQLGLNREVALKVILGASFVSPENRERFRVEAEAAANLQDRHVVPLYEIGEHEGHDFYSMAYIKGGTLKDHFEELRKDKRKSVKILATLARTIQIAHDRGILHRDLKPDNILIDEDGEPLISDFGLAYNLDLHQSLTLTGQIIGTPQYMAPEQADGDSLKITTQADVYSLGAILYEFLAGVPPFDSDSIFKTLQMVKEANPSPLKTHVPDIDKDLSTIVAKCLEKDPTQRYRSAKDLAEDLEAWLNHQPISARPPSTLERISKWVKRRPIHAALVALAALFILTLGIGGPIIAIHQSELRNTSDKAFALADERAEENRQQFYFSDMNLGGLALTESGMFPSLNSIVSRWNPKTEGKDRRGWEWYFLSSSIHQAEFELHEKEAEIVSLRVSPDDDEFLVSGKFSPSIDIHNLSTGELLRKIKVPDSGCRAIWNPSKTQILAATGSLTLYDAVTEEILANVEKPHPPKPYPASCAWHPNGTFIASAGIDGFVRFWNSETLKPLGAFRPVSDKDLTPTDLIDRTNRLEKIAWSPDGKYLAIMGQARDDHNIVYVKLVEDPESPIIRLAGHGAGIQDIAWSPDSKTLATAGNEKLVRLFQVPEGTVETTLQGHTGWITGLAWNSDGTQLASATINQEIKIWDPKSATEIESLPGAAEDTTALAWSHDDSTILWANKKGEIKAWSLNAPRVSRVLFRREHGLSSISWSPDGSQLVCSGKGNTYVVDAATGKATTPNSFPKSWNQKSIPSTWSPDGRSITYQHNPHFVSLLNPKDGHTTRRFRTPLPEGRWAPVIALAWKPDSSQLVTCSYNSQINLWDIETGHRIKELDVENQNNPGHLDISWSPDGNYILTSGKQDRINLWNGRTHEKLSSRIGGNSSDWHTGHAWHPDSSFFATGNYSNQISIWRPDPLAKVRSLQGHTSDVRTVSWHPDGKRLASGSGDHTIKIWDVDAGVTTITLRGHTNDVTEVAWSPNGQILASSSLDGTIRLWDASKAYSAGSKTAPQ